MKHSRVIRSALATTAPLLVMLAALAAAATGTAAPASGAPRLAVFEFELDDSSASAAPSGERASDIAILHTVTRDTEEALRKSGRYEVLDAAAVAQSAPTGQPLRECDGCEAPLALKLGADLAFLGVVSKVEQAAYAVEVQIRDARTGKVLTARREVFLGSSSEWSSGVSSLLRRLLSEPKSPP